MATACDCGFRTLYIVLGAYAAGNVLPHTVMVVMRARNGSLTWVYTDASGVVQARRDAPVASVSAARGQRDMQLTAHQL